jgi:hypothetical protein
MPTETDPNGRIDPLLARIRLGDVMERLILRFARS